MKLVLVLFLLMLISAQGLAQSDSLKEKQLTKRDFVALEYQFDHFSNDIQSWNTLTAEYQTNKINSWILLSRISLSNRFGVSAVSLEQDAYKKFKSEDYLFVQVGYSPSDIFSRYRGTVEYFNPFAKKWEHSIGVRYFQFQDSINVLLGTASLSKYSGRFLTILRLNAGFQNSSKLNLMNGSLQQRFYHTDHSYSALYAGYGVDPNTILFNNSPFISVQKNNLFLVGFKTLWQIGTHWFAQGQIDVQYIDFGIVQRNQFTYSLKAYYTW